MRLKTDPNPMAMMVHTKQITLYGMLKSGVGRDTSNVSVCSLKTRSLGSREEMKSCHTAVNIKSPKHRSSAHVVVFVQYCLI